MARVLMVEDNADNREIYRTVLIHTGYEVIEAHDGETGVELARQLQPDLILMDISLPRMTGWEATRVLKDLPETAAIPIIALTAHAYDHDRKRGEELGFAEYLSKPIPPLAVVEAVARVLTASTRLPPPPAGC